MEQQQYNSIYQGIVIQNNDPERRGRVKVYVPFAHFAVYEKWLNENKDKNFKFIGQNIDSDITPIIEDLKLVLPWAEMSMPLTSENTSARYNNYHNVGSISDSNFYENFTNSKSTKPGEFYEKSYTRLNDAFDGSFNTTNKANPYSYMYKPNTYSNKAKGSFGVPSVGSHVYVFFIQGDPLFPVVMGASFGKDDWSGIYDDEVNYPGKFENYSPGVTQSDHNVETYRNKYVLNQKGGNIEITNTDLNEKVKINHYSGSFKEFNNGTNIELASNNDQKLVLNDKFETVQGFNNTFTKKSYDEIVLRDKYKKVGNLNSQPFEDWKKIVDVIQDNKQLFEIKRTYNNDVLDGQGNIIIKRNSIQQERIGEFRLFPVTDGTLVYNTVTGVVAGTIADQVFDIISSVAEVPEDLDINDQEQIKQFALSNTDLIKSPSLSADVYDLTQPQFLATGLSAGSGVNVLSFSEYQLLTQEGEEVSFPPSLSALEGITEGLDFVEITRQPGTPPSYIQVANSEQNGPLEIEPFKASTFALLGASVNSWPQESGRDWGPGGAGKSLSTQDGNWEIETAKEKDNLQALIQSQLQTLTNIEQELGLGGSEIIEVAKHKVETIGNIFNDFGSIRMDNIGKLISNEVLVSKDVAYVNKQESPLIEYVHVQDLPGGNYTLNVNNRFNVLVGAGGIDMKSYGAVNVSGTITNIAGEQVNISSENEVNIDSKTINISGEILRLRNKKQRQVLVDSSLGITNNVVIGGSLYVDGGLYTHHISAPLEWQVTNATLVYGKPTEKKIGTTAGGVDVFGIGAEEDSIICYEHSHLFPNVPLKLYRSHSQLRDSAKDINTSIQRLSATPVIHEYKGVKIDEEFTEQLGDAIIPPSES